MKATVTYIGLLILFAISGAAVFGQGVGINTDGSVPDASAVFHVQASNRGLLTPRMTKNERDAIAAPATGLLIYQLDDYPGFRFYDGTDWQYLRGMVTIPGTVNTDAGCIVSNDGPADYPGVSATVNCVTGTGQVTWPAGLFEEPPIVNISSSIVPVPPPAPDIYCIPAYSAACNSTATADQITGVRIYHSTNGLGGPWGAPIMERLSGCEGVGNGNYFEVPITTATATLRGNVGGGFCSNNAYRIEIRSSTEWSDWVQAWIDWNADGDFLDAEEHIPNICNWGASSGAWLSSQAFQVPNFALNGNTVMRCRSIWTNTCNPCQGGVFGETEDYTLTIECATSGSAPEIPSYCGVTEVTLTSFEYKCSLLSGSPIAPPKVFFELIPSD
jgi:hypothetical protein